MKNLERIRVLGSVYVVLYVVALYFAALHSIWGNLVLATLDVFGLVVAILVFKRAVEVLHWATWQQAGPILQWVVIGMVISLIVHLIGVFLPRPEDQLLCAYAPIGVAITGAVLYWFNTRKWPHV